MARNALLPLSAPFAADHRATLDDVLSTATPLQRTWLAGFLAGLDAAAGGAEPVAAPQAPPAEPITILYASESGNAERLAQDAAKLARKTGLKPTLLDFADLDVAQLASVKHLVVVAATWGEGDPPSRAARAYGELMGPSAPRLEGTRFAVLALGDMAYAQFCATGKAIDARLADLGATRAAERIDCDLDFDAPAAAWTKDTLKIFAPAGAESGNVVAVDFKTRAAEASRDPVEAEIIEHINLNSSRSDKKTIHLALSFPNGAPAYEPGDSLDIFPQNDPTLVEAVLAAASVTADEALRSALTGERDITTLSAQTVEKYAAATDHAALKQMIARGETRAWIEGRHLIDLLESFPATLSAEQFIALTRPLPPRAYSIASSRKEFPDEAHLLVSAVRYETHGRARQGVASVHIADRLKAGATVKVRLKPNKHFRLPKPDADIIMVGSGTGLAPFRAFLQERRAAGATGRAWLFFGDRNFRNDFLYQTEWQDALEDGTLTRLDLAFSRDQPEKIYVQQRLWQQRDDLVAWLEAGASFYVCGDAKAMAKDVRATLTRAFADVKGAAGDAAEAALATIEREGRYLQDVY
ncbi:MAG: sulfite reductase flavoprotein subunit alpha [Variibacter sp.]